MNDYFVNIAVDVSGARDNTSELEAAPHRGTVRHFSFTPVNDADVLTAIVKMTSNAVGVYNISLRFLKEA
ncbi:hypothetical protein J6590_067992 [Homalodisca vitripennis]|nr:hypothetical protein J6590_067992 [Homalodisca vitripennis]